MRKMGVEAERHVRGSVTGRLEIWKRRLSLVVSWCHVTAGFRWLPWWGRVAGRCHDRSSGSEDRDVGAHPGLASSCLWGPG